MTAFSSWTTVFTCSASFITTLLLVTETTLLLECAVSVTNCPPSGEQMVSSW